MPRVIAAALAAVFVAAAPANAASVYRSPGYKGTRKAPTIIPQAPPTAINVGAGEKPSVLVDAAGTAHIVWNEPRGNDADAVGYCRLKRGASACDVRQDLVPTGPDDGRGGPLYNSEVGRPQVFAVGDQVAIVTHRYPNPFIAPDGSTSERSTFLFVSNDGGATFSPGALTGSIESSGIGTVFGPPDAPRIGLISDTQTDGPYFQALSGATYEKRQVDLGVDGVESSLVPVGNSVMAAFTEVVDDLVHIRQWSGQGDIYDAASWSSSSFPGAEPILASGPAGVFVMSRPPAGGDRHYDVRSVAAGGASFGAPVKLAGSEQAGSIRNLIEDGSGRLLASWTQSTAAGIDVVQSSATDGRTWAPARTLMSVPSGGAFRAIDTAATDDGGGFAVADESATGGDGPIVAAPFGNQSATGKLGLGSESGGAAPPDVVEKCARLEFSAVDIDLPEGCLLAVKGQPGVRVAEGAIKLNGLEIIPRAGVKFLFNSKKRTIDTTGIVTVQVRAPGIDPVVLFTGELHINMSAEQKSAADDGAQGCTGTRLASFDSSAVLKGFPVSGSIAVYLTDNAACIPLSLELPKIFGGITGSAVLHATNADGLIFDSLRIDVNSAWVGPILIKNVHISYMRTGDIWDGGAQVGIPPQPGPLVIGATVRFEGGKFKMGSLTIPLGYPGVQIGTFPAYLYQLSGAFGLDPVFIEVGASVGVIPVPPSYAIGINGRLRMTFGDPITFEVHGDASIYDIQVAQVAFFLAFDGYVRFSGQLSLDYSPVFSVKGGVDVFADLPNAEFGASVTASVCITLFCKSGEVVISNKGIAACIPSPYILGHWFVGYHWGDPPWDINPDFFSCGDIDDYKIAPTRGGLKAAQAGARTFDVAAGQKSVNVRLLSAGDDSPSVKLVSPSGEQIVPNGDGSDTGAKAFFIKAKGRTFIGIPNPAAGTWQVVPDDGSAAITEVATAGPLPAPEEAGSVGGKGRNRILSYRASTGNGLKTTFAEKGKFGMAVIGDARGKRGTLKFTPAQGPAGKREIVAVVERNGLPRLQKTVATYNAPGPLKPGKVKGLKLTRRGKTVTATWKRLAGVANYGIAFVLPDGRTVLRVTSAKATSAVFKGAPRKGRVTVTVQARDRAGRAGKKATARR